MKSRAVALGVAVLLITGTWAAAGATHVYEPALEAKEGLVFVGGPIRLGTNFALHANGTHAVPGVKSVKRRANCDIDVHVDSRKGDKVVSVLVDEDETVSRLGITAGASGGLNKISIQMWRNGKRICPNDKRFGAYGNLWLQILIFRPSAAVDESESRSDLPAVPERSPESERVDADSEADPRLPPEHGDVPAPQAPGEDVEAPTP
ncbi:hypothetical protein [Aeromicrobium sp. 50.2.37]|uniref:hypothetical protein n=1 Tax=Aeromicrobium sp. 50.2.37 TaxID=2969305 RepID=UPI00214FF0D2|nr:hypothetical protein [Aeromicrobium sp. 50.2.37]MCR4511904.1 hypothetical protein [Aeromicrobium sp. 50.2.37]